MEEAFIDKLALEKGGTDVTMPNGIIFYGPQSTGKTLFAKAFMEQSGCNPIEINMRQTDEKILEDIAKAGLDSEKLYSSSPDKKRTIILLDEFDSIAHLDPNEKGNVLKEDNIAKLKNFLQLCADRYKCTLFMTTNHPLRIDTELLAPHRVPYQVFLGPPEKENVAEIFKFYLRGNKQVIDYNKLADEVMNARKTDHAFSTGQIEFIVRTVRESEATAGPVTEARLLKQIQNIGPDIRPEVLKGFIKDVAEMAKRMV